MGYNTVAVLYNDFTYEIEKAMPRMAEAMRSHASQDRRDFNCGQVVSWDHADGYQAVVVHGNTGWRLGDDRRPIPEDAMRALLWQIDRAGWKKVRGKWVKSEAKDAV